MSERTNEADCFLQESCKDAGEVLGVELKEFALTLFSMFKIYMFKRNCSSHSLKKLPLKKKNLQSSIKQNLRTF